MNLFIGRLAMAKPIVGSMSDWSGALKDLFRQIDDGSLTLYHLRGFLEHRDPFATFPDINWQLTYEHLDMKSEYVEASKKLALPSANPSFWVVSMIPGITPNKVVAGYRKLEVDVYTYVDDLDADVTKNDRDPNRDGAYLVGFRRTIESDEENKNLSAIQLAERNHKGIVLCERLALGFGYFVTTGQHFDVKNVTLCTGSRNHGGYVPSVFWDPDCRGVHVGWDSPDYSIGSLRSRSVQFLSLVEQAKPA